MTRTLGVTLTLDQWRRLCSSLSYCPSTPIEQVVTKSECLARIEFAGPDMLAALKATEDAVMFVRDQFLVHSAPHHDGLRGWIALQETIQAAIAKATNTQQGKE